MHKVYECAHKKIEEIIEHGITSSNLGYLGALVDICKDVTQMDYWKAKVHMIGGDGQDKIGEVMRMSERYANTMDEHDRVSLYEKADRLVEEADTIRKSLSSLKDDPEFVSHYKRVFR